MTEQCGEILGAGGTVGVVWCVLPPDHEGDHDGGARERQLGDEFAAQQLERMMEHEHD